MKSLIQQYEESDLGQFPKLDAFAQHHQQKGIDQAIAAMQKDRENHKNSKPSSPGESGSLWHDGMTCGMDRVIRIAAEQKTVRPESE